MPLQGRYVSPPSTYRDEYYVRELTGGTVVWVGEHIPAVAAPPAPSLPPEFTNVFLGRRIRTGLRGELVDVPKGQARNVFKNVLVGIGSGEPPANIYFNLPGLGRRHVQHDPRYVGGVARREWLSGFGVPDPTFLTGDYLTGVWRGDDGGTYYIHQYGLRVVWFGEQLDAAGWANVFFGRISGTTLSGQWFDVPKGSASGYGTLDLTVTSPTQLDRSGTGGGYGGRRWNKVP
jgi:hypothetical protein